jgi:hypothetical protein
LRNPWNQSYLQIIRNELSYIIAEHDIEYSGGMLTLREKPGRILFRAEFKPPCLSVTHGLFWHNGICVHVDHRGLKVLNSPGGVLSNCTANFCSAGVTVGRSRSGSSAFHLLASVRLVPTGIESSPIREIPEDQIDIGSEAGGSDDGE